MYALIHGLGYLDCICMDANVNSILSGLPEGFALVRRSTGTSCREVGEVTLLVCIKSGEDSPLMKLLSHITRMTIVKIIFSNMSVVCRLFDDEDLVEKAEFKPAWNGFLRMYNVYQFIPGAVFITSRGIAEGQYLWLMTEAKGRKARVAVDAEALAVLRSMTDAYIHPFLSLSRIMVCRCRKRVMVCDENGQVIAAAELGWPDQRLLF